MKDSIKATIELGRGRQRDVRRHCIPVPAWCSAAASGIIAMWAVQETGGGGGCSLRLHYQYNRVGPGCVGMRLIYCCP